MRHVILVGGGLAGTVLAFRLHEEGIPFTLINEPSLSASSRVAAGLWNPLVFKRMSKSWMAEELIPELHRFYSSCEALTSCKFLRKRSIIKPFTENQEKVLWKKRVKQELLAFADEQCKDGIPEGYEACKFSNGYGVVRESGNLYIQEFIEAGEKYFKNQTVREEFEYRELKILEQELQYKSINANAIIFCEGYKVKNNPFFSWIPLKPAKGEVLHIQASEIKFKNGVFNKNGFILDTRESKFIVGSTYNWKDLDDQPTEEGRVELQQKLDQMLHCNYTIEAHLAGVRPSSLDRRPIIGPHPIYHSLHVFNGLGAKGVMLAPYFAGKFVHFLMQKQALPEEVDVARFYKHYAG